MKDPPTDPELARFLAGRQPFLEEELSWRNQEIRLVLAAYLSPDLPPRRLVSSVRAIVLRAGEILVQRSVEDVHVLPGGRLESGEGPEEGLHREILEETGWRVEVLTLLGFEYFHHLTPKPPGYAYPYPDFLWAIYLARAVEPAPEGRVEDGYELGSDFRSIDEARTLGLTPVQLQYIEAAVAAERRA